MGVMRKLLLFFPLALFVALGVFFMGGLKLDQSVQPSAMIDAPVPAVELVALPGIEGPFSPQDFEGQVTLVNIFGSWCAPCRVEHPLLVEIGETEDVALFGIDWRDTPERGAQWLADFGNPYDKAGNDETGRAVIEFGVTGVPETFIVDSDGRIRYRHVGPLSRDTWEKTVRPIVASLQAEIPETAGPEGGN